MRDLTLREARELLTEYAAIMRSRDERILAAVAAGLTVSDCAVLLEVTRGTIYRALDNNEKSEITEG